MTDKYLSIYGPPPQGGWVLGIVSRLQSSSSPTLQDRRNAWAAGPLSEMGLALATKLSLLGVVTRRVDEDLRAVSDQLGDPSEIQQHLVAGHACYVADPDRPDLLYETLADIESFIFESRSAFEITGRFLGQLFRDILGCDMALPEIERQLRDRGVDTRWIEELRANRILFFHDTAPWIAVYVDSLQPLKLELVVLKKNVHDFTNPDDYFHFQKLREIYAGFTSSLDALAEFVKDEIRLFEEAEQT